MRKKLTKSHEKKSPPSDIGIITRSLTRIYHRPVFAGRKNVKNSFNQKHLLIPYGQLDNLSKKVNFKNICPAVNSQSVKNRAIFRVRLSTRINLLQTFKQYF